MCNVNIDSVLFNSIRENTNSFNEALSEYLKQKLEGISDKMSISSPKYQLSQKDEDFYMSQVNENSTLAQKEAVKSLLLLQNKIKYKDGKYVSALDSSIEYKRVSNVISDMKGPYGKEGFYKFDGDSSQFKDSRDWGNIIDHILESVILNKDINTIVSELENLPMESDTASITAEAVVKLINIFESYKASHPGAIILTQQILFNDEKKIAGTADVMLVMPDGSVEIHDLKSSINPTEGEYTRTSQSGNTYTNSYDKRFRNDKASKKEKHTAQLSLYSGLAKSKNINVTKTKIVPIHITNVNDGSVSDINKEPDINMPLNLNIEATVSNDSNTVFEFRNQDKYLDFYDRIKKTLAEKLKALQNKGNESQRYYIEQLQLSIKSATAAGRLSVFINDVHQFYKGNPATNYKGQEGLFNDILNKIDSGKYTDEQKTLETLNNFNQMATLYNGDNGGIVESLLDFYNEEYRTQNIPFEKGSPIDKLREVYLAIKTIKGAYRGKASQITAKMLARTIDPNIPKSMKSEINKYKERLAKWKKKGKNPKHIKRLEARIKTLMEDAAMDENGNIDMEAKILREMTSGEYKDIPITDMWTTPMISQNHSTIASFAKKVKEVFEGVRFKAREFAHDAQRAFKKYHRESKLNRNNVAEFNEGLYETTKHYDGLDDAGNPKFIEKQSFVQPINVTKYTESKANLYQKIAEMKKLQDKTIEEKLEIEKKMIKDWYSKNHQARAKYDIKIGNTVLIKGIDSIKADMLETMKRRFPGNIAKQKREHDNWWSSNAYMVDGEMIYRGELSMPNLEIYSSDKFTINGPKITLNKSTSANEYYEYLISTFFKSKDRLPQQGNEFNRYTLPSISKEANDRIRENGLINYFSYKVKDATQLLAEDNDIVGDNLKSVPILFTQTMDVNDVSLDLIASVMRFEEASLRYEAQTSLVPLADSTSSLLNSVSPEETDSSGVRILDKIGKKLGLSSHHKYKKKHGNNAAALLEQFIDVHIYGRKQLPGKKFNFFGYELDGGKIANAIMSFASKTQLTINPMLSVANSLQGNVMNMIESVTGKYFNKRQLLSAQNEYRKNIGNMIKDINDGVATSKLGQLIDLYDAVQGNFKDKFGRNISPSAMKRMASTDILFFLQNHGEHQIQVTAMIAMLNNTKVKKVVNGKETEITLYDAYEVGKNSKIKLQEGVQIEGNVIGEILPTDIQNRMHAMNKRLHGVYNEFDAPIMERYTVGRLILMYRKFLVPGFKKRWKREGIDYELGEVTEGTYMTFLRTAREQHMELLKTISPFNKDSLELTDTEIANVKRAAAEFAFIFAVGLITIILGSAYDDEPDEKARLKYAYPLYWSMRLGSELGFYGGIGDPQSYFLPNPYDAARTVMTPTIASSTTAKIWNFGMQLLSPTEVYKSKSGVWEKGSSKLWAKTLKLLGYNGYTLNPSVAIDMLKLQTRQ